MHEQAKFLAFFQYNTVDLNILYMDLNIHIVRVCVCDS